jgi:HEPN superfamily protein
MEGLQKPPISPRQRALQAGRTGTPAAAPGSKTPQAQAPDDSPAGDSKAGESKAGESKAGDTQAQDPQAHDPQAHDPQVPEHSERSDPEEVDMSATTLARPPVSTAARMLLERSRAGLLQALNARSPGERYVTAHLAALRAAAAVLAVRSRPGGRGGPRSVWEVMPRVAPELGEWASFFASTASRRAAIEAGRTDLVSPREADDLLRDAEAFHHLVESSLGLPYQQVLPLTLPSCD